MRLREDQKIEDSARLQITHTLLELSRVYGVLRTRVTQGRNTKPGATPCRRKGYIHYEEYAINTARAYDV